MKAFYYIIAISVLCLINGCVKDIYAEVEIKNNTDESVMIIEGVVTYDYEILQPNEFHYWYLKEYLDTIRPHEKCTRHILIENYGTPIYDNGRHIQCLLWKQSTLEKFTLDEIVQKNIYDKRYKYTNDELASLKVVFEYNGE